MIKSTGSLVKVEWRSLENRLCLLLVLASILPSYAQWDQYEAVWRGRPGTMLVNMDIKERAPIPELRYLIEIVQDVRMCDEYGYASVYESNWTETVALTIDSLISTMTLIEDVGRLTYQCQIKDYYYVADTTGINLMISGRFDPSIIDKIMLDEEWKVYQEFIYPDEYLIETMTNSKIIGVLLAENYNLEEKNDLTHFASFSNEDDRERYKRFVEGQNFEVKTLEEQEDKPMPYLISFYRKDKLQLAQLSNITLRLHQKSLFLNGAYEGWEIVVENNRD